MNLLTLTCLTGTFLFSISRTLPADNTFVDGTFNTTDWTSAVALDTTTTHSSTFATMQVTSGGDPNYYRSMNLNYGSGGSFYVSNLYNAASYVPTTSGAVSTLTYSYDLEETNPPFAGAVVGYYPLVAQDGVFYIGPHATATVGGWKLTTVTGLTAANFSNLTSTGALGTAHPNYSFSADSLQFGYYSADSGQSPTYSGLDNFEVNIISVVPEPGSFWITFGGAMLLAVCVQFIKGRKPVENKL